MPALQEGAKLTAEDKKMIRTDLEAKQTGEFNGSETSRIDLGQTDKEDETDELQIAPGISDQKAKMAQIAQSVLAGVLKTDLNTWTNADQQFAKATSGEVDPNKSQRIDVSGLVGTEDVVKKPANLTDWLAQVEEVEKMSV